MSAPTGIVSHALPSHSTMNEPPILDKARKALRMTSADDLRHNGAFDEFCKEVPKQSLDTIEKIYDVIFQGLESDDEGVQKNAKKMLLEITDPILKPLSDKNDRKALARLLEKTDLWVQHILQSPKKDASYFATYLLLMDFVSHLVENSSLLAFRFAKGTAYSPYPKARTAAAHMVGFLIHKGYKDACHLAMQVVANGNCSKDQQIREELLPYVTALLKAKYEMYKFDIEPSIEIANAFFLSQEEYKTQIGYYFFDALIEHGDISLLDQIKDNVLDGWEKFPDEPESFREKSKALHDAFQKRIPSTPALEKV